MGYAMVPDNLLSLPDELFKLWVAIRLRDWEKSGKERQGCTATMAELAEAIGASERAVRENVHRLQDRGAIRVERRPGYTPLIFCTPESYNPEITTPCRRWTPRQPVAAPPGNPLPDPNPLPMQPVAGPPCNPLPDPPGNPLQPHIDLETYTETLVETKCLPACSARTLAAQGDLAPIKKSRRAATIKTDQPSATALAWRAYAAAYERRYGVAPLHSARLMGMFRRLVELIGVEEAPRVAAFYPTHDAAFYVQAGHAVNLLLRDAQKLHTEMVTGRRINAQAARQQEQTAANPFLQILDDEIRTNGRQPR